MTAYLPPNPNPPTSIFNSSEFSPYINNSTLNYVNNNFLSLTGGVITGNTNFLNTLTLGVNSGTSVLSTVPLNVINYCNTNISSMIASGNPYTPGVNSYYINSIGVRSSILTSGTFSYSGMFGADVASNAFINFSDKRIKTNIINLPDSIVDDFINRCEPKLYNLISNINNDDFGYIAQDLYKNGFSNIVQLVPDETMKEEIDNDGFISPKNIKFTIAYTKIIPILHSKIKMQDIKMTLLEEQVRSTSSLINDLENRILELEKK